MDNKKIINTQPFKSREHRRKFFKVIGSILFVYALLLAVVVAIDISDVFQKDPQDSNPSFSMDSQTKYREGVLGALIDNFALSSPQLTFLSHYFFVFLLCLLISYLVPGYKTETVILLDGKQYEFASLNRRMAALFIDLISYFFVVGLITLLLMTLGRRTYAEPGIHWTWTAAKILWVSSYFIFFFYLAYFEGHSGATLGKRIMKIQILTEEGKHPGFGRGLIRNVLRIADIFLDPAVGIAFIAFTDNWQRVGDLAARTVVVRKKEIFIAKQLNRYTEWIRKR